MISGLPTIPSAVSAATMLSSHDLARLRNDLTRLLNRDPEFERVKTTLEEIRGRWIEVAHFKGKVTAFVLGFVENFREDGSDEVFLISFAMYSDVRSPH